MKGIDFLGKDASQGQIAAYIKNQGRMNPGALRPYLNDKGIPMVSVYTGGDPKDPKCYKAIQVNAATLRKDEWKQMDEALMQISRERLGGFQDLIDNNLTYNLGNAFGTTVLESQNGSDAFEASLTMDGLNRGKNDRQQFETVYLPIPIIHVDYEINLRQLESSRKLGNPLDTSQAELAARQVNNKLEDMLFQNTSYAFGGGTIYSYVNYPDRNPFTISVSWATATGAEIVADVIAMKQAAINKKQYGPYKIYIPTGYETALDKDYDATTPGTTIRERVLKIANISGIMVVDHLEADSALLVQMTSDVVRLVQGLGITNVEWQTEGQFVTNYKVMRISVPQIRSDQDGNCGIVHGSV